jgi:hypothetical protein
VLYSFIFEVNEFHELVNQWQMVDVKIGAQYRWIKYVNRDSRAVALGDWWYYAVGNIKDSPGAIQSQIFVYLHSTLQIDHMHEIRVLRAEC